MTTLAMRLFSGAEHHAFSLPGTKPVVMALHGFMGTPAELRPLAKHLAGLGAAVSVPLLPGFGSELARLPSVRAHEWFAFALERWREVRTSSSGPVVLLGFSMGAAIALHVAALSPPDQLVLVAPFTRLLPGDWRVPLLPVIRRFRKEFRPFANADFRDSQTRQILQAIDPGLDLDDPAVQMALRNVRLPLAVLDELRKTGKYANAAARRVQCPVLVIQGCDDQTVPRWTTRQLVATLAGRVALVEVPGGHQLVRTDHPSAELTFRLIGQFIAGGLA